MVDTGKTCSAHVVKNITGLKHPDLRFHERRTGMARLIWEDYTVFAGRPNRPTLLPSAYAPETPTSQPRKGIIAFFFVIMLQIINTFVKINKLFKRLTILIDVQNVSLLPLNTLQVS
jgi:hypothetical protein